MKLEIVTHCWHYTRLLTYQLSSVTLFAPQKVEVLVTVFSTDEDVDTVDTVDYFASRTASSNVSIRCWLQPKKELFRRAIGRNLAALATTSDWIWFTDCDYLFRQNCLDSLPNLLEKVNGPLAFPRRVQTNITHQHGDRAIDNVTGAGVYDIDENDFASRRMSRAIGGVQIVRSSVAREVGYLNGSRRLRPCHGAKFSQCREDRRFRLSVQTSGQAIELPGVYRIRHSVAGRQTADAIL